MKTILITGSNGLTGQKLIQLLKNQPEINLVATSKSPDRFPDNTGYIFETLDITNFSECDYIISKYKPEVLINASGATNADECEADHVMAMEINLNGVKNLVKCCNKYQAQLIHLSTDFVFDGVKGMYSESDTPNPVSFYGYSKLAGEEYVLENAVSKAVVRTVLVYGLNKNMVRSNIVLWVKNNLEQGNAIKVVDDQFRTPTYAEDLALGCLLVAENNAQGIFHISGPQYLSIYEMALKVAEVFNLDKALISPVSSISLNEKAKRPPRTGFDITKARIELGYNPVSFDEGLKLFKEQLGKFV
ncbi:MAG: NAD(P)-dependent oxidoreductase [Bacteroidetes bacterium GWF2_38_335]|nr:MAG: NAD(P)-dependent oxidoreductase [Bacteroidetes bacterium GWF2_38_335]OFY80161.1 MAG: NAD(P)-dependent oxidoreductase [Bacteroidetes bacterium RIFOXYA12_FULL_38_20]HBS88510.1 NAD(P)-dependent oxidoreductase [Bacteroidales bacterium]